MPLSNFLAPIAEYLPISLSPTYLAFLILSPTLSVNLSAAVTILLPMSSLRT